MAKQQSYPGEIEFEMVEVDKPCPEHVPAGWMVFNAFRPLAGSLIGDEGGFTWEDPKGPNGRHFATVDPMNEDGYTETWLRMNKSNGAVILKYQD